VPACPRDRDRSAAPEPGHWHRLPKHTPLQQAIELPHEPPDGVQAAPQMSMKQPLQHGAKHPVEYEPSG
jgi:hypothetical protein